MHVPNIVPEASNENLKTEKQREIKLNIKTKWNISFQFWKFRGKKKRNQMKKMQILCELIVM